MIPKLTDDYMAEFPVEFKMDPEKTALIIIDMQYSSASRTEGLGKILNDSGRQHLGTYRFDRIETVIMPNVQKLLAYFRDNKLRVIYVTLGSLMEDFSDILPHRRERMKRQNARKGEREHEILDEIKPLPNEIVVNKTTPSAFNSSTLEHILRVQGIESCVFVGVSTHVCVEGTARDASDKGFHCVLVEDACGSNKPEYHNNAIEIFQRVHGRVASTDDVIGEISR